MQKASEPIEDFIFLQSLKRLADARADLHKAQVAGRLVKFRLNQDRKYFPGLFMQQVWRGKGIDSFTIISHAATRMRVTSEEARELFEVEFSKPNPGSYSRKLKQQSSNLLIQKILIVLLFIFNIFMFWFLFVN